MAIPKNWETMTYEEHLDWMVEHMEEIYNSPWELEAIEKARATGDPIEIRELAADLMMF